MAAESSQKRGRALLALLLMATGHSDTQIFQAVPGVTEADLKGAMRFLHRRLAPLDPVVEHLRADLRARKRSPWKARGTTRAHRERVWKLYSQMNPAPKREDVVRLFRVSLGFARQMEGARRALERNEMDPVQFGLEEALEAARVLREVERVRRNAEKQRLWRRYRSRHRNPLLEITASCTPP